MNPAFPGQPDLSGRTLLRFAHAFEGGGGTERYLDDLDRTLLERHALRIIRLHLTRRSPTPEPSVIPTGRGELVLVPLPVISETSPARSGAGESLAHRLKQRLRDGVLYQPPIWQLWGRRWVNSLRLPRLPGQAIGAGKVAQAWFARQPVDLAVIHFAGCADAEEVIRAAREAGVPVVLLNHYSNERYRHAAMRKHVFLARGVAGVNGLQVPGYLGSRLVNLSDGIDTAFFCRAHARPLRDPPRDPVLLLPARVVREKGQLDLVRAAGELRRGGVRCSVAFAGRADPSPFLTELQEAIAREGLDAHCRFLGVLNLEALRDWYAGSAVMAFPTYHDEGLGRVIPEAQAMGTPVVAYATGGVAEAVQDGKTGYLVKTGDLAALTQRIRAILEKPAHAQEMGTAGRLAAEQHFSLSALAARHEVFYRETMTRPDSAGHPQVPATFATKRA